MSNDRSHLLAALLMLTAACQNEGAAPAAQSRATAAGAPESAAMSGISPTPAITAATGAASSTPSTASPPSAGASTASPIAGASAAQNTKPSSPIAGSNPPAAGSGSANAGSAAAPAAMPPSSKPAAPGCKLANSFTRATRVTLEVFWPETIGLVGATGSLVTWGKAVYTRNPDGTIQLESRPCGSQTPVVMSTELIGGLKSSVQVPASAFDSPSMPKGRVTLTPREDGSLSFASSTVLGAMLPDPEGAWPALADLMPADHDGDGSAGLTAIPMEGPAYLTPPSSVSQTEFLDRVYIATRVRLQVSIPPGCEGTHQGVVEPLGFNYNIIGCHVKDRDECTAAEARFISNQSPRFTLGKSATWTEVEIPADASCADVRAALPGP